MEAVISKNDPYHESHWCDCDAQEKGCGTYYVDDGEDDICYKHHYRCEACDGITQIG